MQSLENFSVNRLISESNGLLGHQYTVTPYEWRTFVAIITKLGNKNIVEIDNPEEEDEFLVADKKKLEVIARWDKLDMLMYTNIEKADFFQGIRSDKSKFKQYI